TNRLRTVARRPCTNRRACPRLLSSSEVLPGVPDLVGVLILHIARCQEGGPLVSLRNPAPRASAARRVVPFESECRPRDGYDDACTDGEEHGTQHVLESVPGMLR